MRVLDPDGKDFKIQATKYPDSVIGTYDQTATRTQVIEDIDSVPALAKVLG